MKRNDFTKMDKIGNEQRLESTLTGRGEVVRVEVFHDPSKKQFYQVQVSEQGRMFRGTDPYKDDWDIREFGKWEKLED